MKLTGNTLFKTSLRYALWFLIFTLMTVQIYAKGQQQNTPSPLRAILPKLDEIAVNDPLFPDKLVRNNLKETSFVSPSTPQLTQADPPESLLNSNATSLTPFAPTGHFENTLIPSANKMVVGVEDILFMYSNAYFNSNKTVYSLNKGLTWRLIEQTNINSIAASPINKNHALMGSDSGTYISYDAGNTWQSPTTPTGGITHIAFSPTYALDRQIFAATNGGYNALGNLIRSQDGGNTWTQIPIPSLPLHFALAPNYNSSKTIIAARGKSGVLFSENGGTNWQNRSTGLDLGAGNTVYEVRFSPAFATDTTLFARTEYGIYRSKSNGVTWSRFLPYIINGFELHPNYGSNKTFFMSASVSSNGKTFNVLFRSQDNGQSFEGLVAYVQNFELSSNYLNNQTIYAQIYSGYPVYTGNPSSDDDIFNGLVRSTDDGQTWYIRAETAPNASTIDLIPSPAFSNDQTVFLVRRGFNDGNNFYTVWKSDALGLVWEQLPLPQTSRLPPIKIALSPNFAIDQTIILLMAEETGQTADLYKSVNGGQNWTLLSNNLPVDANREPNLKLSPNYPQDKTIFISDYDEGLFRSVNDGQSWQQLYGGSAITSIAVAPEYPSDNRLFVSLYNNGIARSDNGGATWTSPNKPGGLALMMDLSPDFLQDNTLFATNGGTSGGGVWKSTDAGNSWVDVSGADLSYYQEASALSTNFTQDRTMAVQVTNRNLYLSEDAGETWFALDGIYYGYEPVGLAVPYWQGRPFPMSATGDGFYLYVWPSQISAGFNCSPNLTLASSETQEASITLGIDSLSPAQWHVNTSDIDSIDWLSILEPDGSLPDFPRFIVDSSQITEPVKTSIQVDIFMSYRQSTPVSAPVFLPCFGTSLPIIAR